MPARSGGNYDALLVEGFTFRGASCFATEQPLVGAAGRSRARVGFAVTDDPLEGRLVLVVDQEGMRAAIEIQPA